VGGLDIIKLTKTPLIHSVLCFNLGVLDLSRGDGIVAISTLGCKHCRAVLNMIRFPDRDPTGFCNSEQDRDWPGF